MPVLHRYTGAPGHYIKSHINGTIVTFQLTAGGHQRLAQANLGNEGARFPLRLLVDLIGASEAYTGGSGVGDPMAAIDSGQLAFDFPEDQETEKLFPACAVTGLYDDLHLVVTNADGAIEAKLLSPGGRRNVAGDVMLSVPIDILRLTTVNQLVRTGKLPERSEATVALRRWLEVEASAFWDQKRDERRPRQTSLGLDEPEGLRLF